MDRGDVGGASGAGRAGAESVTLAPLAVAEPGRIDGLRLVAGRGGPVLLYSTQARVGARAALEIRAADVTAPARATLVASIPRLLPPPPQWDARAGADGGYEFLVQEIGGAVNAVTYRVGADVRAAVTAAHPLESFAHPRFVSAGPGDASGGISAVADGRRIVVFPPPAGAPAGGAPAPYRVLAEADDGLVGRAQGEWVVSKTIVGGPARFDVLPGRLALLRVTSPGRAPARTSLSDAMAFEFDAATLGNDVAVFATGGPARLLLASRPARPVALTAGDAGLPHALSRPTLLVAGGTLHLAALAHPGTSQAVVLYGRVPTSTLTP